MMPVSTYELLMDAADLKWLRQHVGTHRCFDVELRTGGQSHVGWIGYRGCYSRWFRKPSYDIWFQDGDGLQGQRKLHLNAAYRDPSMLRGPLAMRVFQDWGVPAPAIWHVWLTMNGAPLGLYQAIESIDADWLRRHGIPDGRIYYAVGTEGNFSLRHSDEGYPKASVTAGYEQCYPTDGDFTDLAALIRAVNQGTAPMFVGAMDRLLDVELCLRWLIGVEFMSHTDGLVQNYALFHPSGGRWQISPWDCDGTWGRTPSGRVLAADEMEFDAVRDNRLTGRLIATPRWRRRYRELWREGLESVLTRAHIVPLLEAMYEGIRPFALQDADKRLSDTTFRREPARIRLYLNERTAVIRGRLARLARSSA